MNLKVKIFATLYIIMILVMFILPSFSFENYTILKNTTSHLAAQHAPYAWIMNSVFVMMAIMSVVTGWSYCKGYLFHRLVLIAFGVSLLGAAYYQHMPIDPSLSFDLNEDEWHSFYSNATGLSFTLFAIATGFVKKDLKSKMLAFGVGILATILSLLMFKITDFMGVLQRMIFILSFGWMISEFKKGNIDN